MGGMSENNRALFLIYLVSRATTGESLRSGINLTLG